MKRIIFIISTAIIVLAASFLWRNFSGLKPAVIPPKPASVNQTQKTVVGSNTTGLPLNIPEGFSISIYADSLGQARVLNFDTKDKLVVSLPDKGQIVTLPEKQVIASNLNRPHGMIFIDKRLYVAETSQLTALDYDSQTRIAKNPKKILDLPPGGGHWTRSLYFLNNRILISVGSSCNVCNESDWRRAKILSWPIDPADTSGLKVFASGLRNSVFMDFNPHTGELWATEMGRDWLGNDLPPDEINIIKEGQNYGWPICYGQNIHDTNFDKNTYIRNPCQAPLETPSFIDLPAHSAPLGLAFIPDSWPQNYRGKLLVAYHGSWNRNPPDGYKIVLIDPQSKQISNFITGWLQSDGTSLGRPVDLVFDRSGNLYISDDKRGVVYRLTPPAN